MSFDLLKVRLTLYGGNREFFYVSKLSVSNFTCYNLCKKQSYCFMWYETVAMRGASEVSSCLFLLLKDICKIPGLNLTLFTDNYIGQSRNRYLFKMLSIAAMTVANISAIELIFLEKVTLKMKMILSILG